MKRYPRYARGACWVLVGAALTLPALAHSAEPKASDRGALAPEMAQQGWIRLFDGETTFGWELHGDAKWRVQDGQLVCTEGRNGWIGTTSVFCDFKLRLEYNINAEGNSGVFFRAEKNDTPWEQGYEMQILGKPDEKFPTGSLYGIAAAKYPPGDTLQATQADRWNAAEIEANGDHIVITVNDRKVLDVHDAKRKCGVIGFQYHFPGMRVAFRNVHLQPLNMKRIFTGKDLAGWRPVPEQPTADRPSVFSVKDGALNIQNGPGQIETTGQYKDFVLQIQVISNGEHLNSGVFFRGTPGERWPGYEAQIRNEWEGDDRTRPVDFGTGAIYRRQPARKVVPNDKEWFTMTVLAHGNHIATWVNGYQTTDWTDPRPLSNDARQGQRLEAGVISLQGHDKTTNLSFRDVRIQEYPAAGK
jgi:hypothetical protein